MVFIDEKEKQCKTLVKTTVTFKQVIQRKKKCIYNLLKMVWSQLERTTVVRMRVEHLDTLRHTYKQTHAYRHIHTYSNSGETCKIA